MEAYSIRIDSDQTEHLHSMIKIDIVRSSNICRPNIRFHIYPKSSGDNLLKPICPKIRSSPFYNLLIWLNGNQYKPN